MKKPLSYSGISTYEQCPSKFKRHYILQEEVKDPPTEATAPQMFRGTRLHKTMEDYLRGDRDNVGPELLAHIVFVSQLKQAGASPEVEFCISNDWEMQPFDAEEGLLRGVIDVESIILEEKRAYLCDWKTGKSYASHADQRALYALATLLKYPEIETVVSSSYYIDQKGKEEKGTYTRDQLSGYKWVWERKANKCRPPQPYPMRPSWKCGSCGFSKKKGGTCPN